MIDDELGLERFQTSPDPWDRLHAMREAALMGYGALMAHNADDKFNQILIALRAILWPGKRP